MGQGNQHTRNNGTCLKKGGQSLRPERGTQSARKINQSVLTPDGCNLLRERTEMPSGQAMGIGRTENLRREEVLFHRCGVSRKEPTGCDWKASWKPQGPAAVVNWCEFIDLKRGSFL